MRPRWLPLRLAPLSVLLLASLLGSARPAHAKRVIYLCSAADLSYAEGIYRQSPQDGDVFVKEAAGGKLTDAWGKLAAGDQLIVWAHGNAGIITFEGGNHAGFREAGTQGKGTGAECGNPYELPALDLANVSVLLRSCYAGSDPDGAGPQLSVVASLKPLVRGEGSTVTGRADEGKVSTEFLIDKNGGTNDQYKSGIVCLALQARTDGYDLGGTAETVIAAVKRWAMAKNYTQQQKVNDVLAACKTAGDDIGPVRVVFTYTDKTKPAGIVPRIASSLSRDLRGARPWSFVSAADSFPGVYGTVDTLADQGDCTFGCLAAEPPCASGTPAVALTCPPDRVLGIGYPVYEWFQVCNQGSCADTFQCDLTDARGWVVEGEVHQVVVLEPGGCATLYATVEPHDCSPGDQDELSWSSAPVSQPESRQSCATVVTADQATAVAFLSFRAEMVGQAVRLEWTRGGGTGVATVRVFRSDGLAGPYRAIGSPLVSRVGEAGSFLDRDIVPGRTYFYEVGRLDAGATSYSAPLRVVTFGPPLGIHSVSPNPSSGGMAFTCEVPRAGRVRLTIFDVTGHRARDLLDAFSEPGELRVSWDGRRSDGRPLPAGTYYAQLLQGTIRSTRTLILLR